MCGISEDEFWRMTLSEFDRRQWAWIQQQEEHAKDSIRIGWWVAQLARQAKIPSLKILTEPARILTPEEAAALQAEHERMIAEMG